MQRKILFIFLLLNSLSFLSLTQEKQNFTLENALQKGLISCTYKANPESPHYMRPLLINVKNKQNEPVIITIATGQQFFPTDEGFQNLIVTRDATIALRPNEQKTVEIFAMCTEASDAAPNKETTYKLAPYASGNLLKTAKFISANKNNDITGQHAIWSISNNRDLEDIIGPDSTEARNLQKFLAKLTGKKLPPPPSANDYASNYYAPPKPEVSYTGNFSMNVYKPASLTIALFNRNNVVVREMYSNPAVPAGEQKFTYAFDNTVYTDDFYWVRIMVDGDIKFNRKVAMNIDN